MARLDSTLTHNGVTYLAEIGTIRKTFLGVEDHGIFTASLDFDFNGSGQGFGFRTLDEPSRKPEDYTRVGTAYGMDFIMQLVEMFGPWESIAGTRAIALRTKDYGTIEGVATLDVDKVFIASEHGKLWFPDA